MVWVGLEPKNPLKPLDDVTRLRLYAYGRHSKVINQNNYKRACPFREYVFGKTQSFLFNFDKILHGTSCQDAGYYYLSISHDKSKVQSEFSFHVDYRGGLFGKIGVVATQAPKGLRPQNLTKKLNHMIVFGQQLPLNLKNCQQSGLTLPLPFKPDEVG